MNLLAAVPRDTLLHPVHHRYSWSIVLEMHEQAAQVSINYGLDFHNIAYNTVAVVVSMRHTNTHTHTHELTT